MTNSWERVQDENIFEGFFLSPENIEILCEAAVISNNVAKKRIGREPFNIEVLEGGDSVPDGKLQVRVGGDWQDEKEYGIRFFLDIYQGISIYNNHGIADGDIEQWGARLV